MANKDHFIPAAFLGQFSDSTKTSARERTVWRATRGRPHPRHLKAMNIGYEEGLYTATIPGAHDREVDDSWAPYERGIPAALQRLRTLGPFGLYDAWTWLHVLVPLLAGMWVRGKTFSHGKQVLLWDNDGTPQRPDDKSNRNWARRAEQARLLAPLMTARWELHYFPHDDLLTSDRGFTLASESGDPHKPNGMTVPIGRHHALVVFRRDVSNVVLAQGNRWVKPIHFATHPIGDARVLNGSIARSAEEFIVGASSDVVRDVATTEFANAFIDGDRAHLMWADTDQKLGLNQMEWFSLRAMLTWPPDDSVRIHWGPIETNPNRNVSTDWIPQPIFALGRPERLTAIARHGGVISCDLRVAWNASRLAQHLASFEHGPANGVPEFAVPSSLGYPNVDQTGVPLDTYDIARRALGPPPPEWDSPPPPLPVPVRWNLPKRLAE